MLTLDVRHPDIMEFITKKQDLTKVTGANISVKLTDDFMSAVSKNKDYVLRFPVDASFEEIKELEMEAPYNILTNILSEGKSLGYAKKVKALDIWNTLVHCAWNTAEPGIMFSDKHINNSPDGVYDEFRGVSTNPCGEIWMQPYDSCRLIHLNLTSIVNNEFTDYPTYDLNTLYRIAYHATRLADDLVDLEIESINEIINHISKSKGDNRIELELWIKLKNSAIRGRRCGIGFTGLADMLAMLNIPYGSTESIEMVEIVMKTIMKAELDCTMDLAITRGAFPAWDKNLEYPENKTGNNFYYNLQENFPLEVNRMKYVGRRHISWNTVKLAA